MGAWTKKNPKPFLVTIASTSSTGCCWFNCWGGVSWWSQDIHHFFFYNNNSSYNSRLQFLFWQTPILIKIKNQKQNQFKIPKSEVFRTFNIFWVLKVWLIFSMDDQLAHISVVVVVAQYRRKLKKLTSFCTEQALPQQYSKQAQHGKY